MYSNTTPTRYTQESVKRFAVAAADPRGYSVHDSPTLYFTPPPRRVAWLLVAALLIGGSYLATRHRVLVAVPRCDKHVQACR